MLKYADVNPYEAIEAFNTYLAIFDDDTANFAHTSDLIIDGAYRTTYDPEFFKITKIED